jgi:outer membrane cobalamin receptor/copper chaperone CopZ
MVMKYIYQIIMFLLLATIGQAQKEQLPGIKTTAFKVYGNCGLCKERIEEAAKGKGIRSAVWDADTKILSLAYDTAVVNLLKVHQRIAAAGHDTELKKAKGEVYSALPACCHYREGSMEALPDKLDQQGKEQNIKETAGITAMQVTGIVLEEDAKGNFRPLPGASVVWTGTTHGVLADSTGVFRITAHEGIQQLVVSFAGYRSDTLLVHPSEEVKVILASGKQLNEVKVSARQRSSYLSSLSSIRTQIITEKELFKAACCNLSESFETNPSVDVSYNDAVTGSKQIQLLGLSGNYTQLTIENLPGPGGIAAPLALNSIAGPWIESIQLTKGIGSVANGFESIAGQINIELKKPENSEKLYLNAYVNDFGKTDLNLNLSKKIGKKWSTALLFHDDFLANKQLDFNKDGFRDQPTGNLISAVNRWKFDNAKGLLVQMGVKILNDDRTGGDVNFDPAKDKLTTNHYGLGIQTQRYEGFGKIGYVFPGKKYKSIGLQLSGFYHQQDSYFGLTTYDARQNNFYSNLIYQSIIGSTAHKFRTGLSMLASNYRENFGNSYYHRNEVTPGGFFEYTYTYNDKFTAVAGLRADHNNLFGFFLTPRLHLRFEPVKGTTFRVSGGKGWRSASIFAENIGVLVSSRQVNIISSANNKGYGLAPEIAWNEGFSIDQHFRVFGRGGTIGIDYFRTDFQNQVVVDLDKSTREVNFYNLNGRSYSNSFQAELNYELVKKLDIRLAWRLFDVKTTYNGLLLQRPLVAKHRAFANLAWDLGGWKLDYTISYNGMKRIPGTSDNPVKYRLKENSPAYVLMNAQVSKSFGKKYSWDIYAGAENTGNYIQANAVLAADQPFSPWFDASLVWGPVRGRMFYTGLRFKIK